MRRIAPYSLWLGHAGDARHLPSLLEAGIQALIDLAVNEPPVAVTRELIYCRFPLVDGSGNPPWLLRSAIVTTGELIRAQLPTLLCCSMGLSRSPAIAAAALASVTGRLPEECLALVVPPGTQGEVSPALWNDVRAAVLTILGT